MGRRQKSRLVAVAGLVCPSPRHRIHFQSGDVRWDDRSQDRTRDCNSDQISPQRPHFYLS